MMNASRGCYRARRLQQPGLLATPYNLLWWNGSGLPVICSRSMKRQFVLLFATRICGTRGQRVFLRVRLPIVQWLHEEITNAPQCAKPLVICLAIVILRYEISQRVLIFLTTRSNS